MPGTAGAETAQIAEESITVAPTSSQKEHATQGKLLEDFLDRKKTENKMTPILDPLSNNHMSETAAAETTEKVVIPQELRRSVRKRKAQEANQPNAIVLPVNDETYQSSDTDEESYCFFNDCYLFDDESEFVFPRY